jgi:hypothetical protein
MLKGFYIYYLIGIYVTCNHTKIPYYWEEATFSGKIAVIIAAIIMNFLWPIVLLIKWLKK